MHRDDKYSIEIRWIESKKRFIATCPEFPWMEFLSVHRSTCLADLEEELRDELNYGRDLPEPHTLED